MRITAGEHVIWKGQRVQIVVVRASSAELRSADGEQFEVEIDELQRHAELVV